MITAKPKLLWLFFYFSLLSSFTEGFSQENHPDPNYRLINTGNYVQAKNYYLLTLFETLPALKKLLLSDCLFQHFAKTKRNALQQALKSCGRDGACYTGSMKFSAQEITEIADKLKSLYQPGNALGLLVKNHLIPSGCYILFQHLPAPEMLAKAWEQDANGINYCIGVYAEGKKPNYPNIDSISFKIRDNRDSGSFNPSYVGFLHNTAAVVKAENEESAFFSIPLTAALRFIEVNEREQAGDYEPMQNGENREAFQQINAIDWRKFKYSLILIPGAGPEDPSVALSAEGMLRCRLAAVEYKKGLAPFIVTSGGKVHPYKTKYCEATEMKRYLVEKLGVPEKAIIIDPHARHTTTNMRNAARLMYRYGIPFNKPALTCTTRGQSIMIERTLPDRCMKELQEIPYKNGSRLDETLVEFYPLVEALQINPLEPMDP